MAGLEGIDASRMEIVDALGTAKWEYDVVDRVVKPLLRHADFAPVAINAPKGDGFERVVSKVRFGMPVAGGRLITNARDDKLTVSNSWKAMFGKQAGHALAVVSYVVEREKKTGEALRIQRADGKPMVVASLIGRRHYTFASTGNEYDDLGHVQVTTQPNSFVASVHDRFVAELRDNKSREAWMNPETEGVESLLNLIRPAPEDWYEMVPVRADIWTRRGDPDAAQPTGPPRRP